MTLKTKLKENIAEEKEILANAATTLKRHMSEYKNESKADWKSLKTKYKKDMDQVKKSVKKLVTPDSKKA